MNPRVLIIALVVLLVAGGAYYFTLPSLPVSPPTPSGPDGKFVPQTVKGPVTHIIFMGAGAFTPSTLAIKAGDTVLFQNSDTIPHWPASAVHPTHQTCPGFDAKEGIAPRESYSYVFASTATCPFHDHLNPGIKGTITVQ